MCLWSISCLMSADEGLLTKTHYVKLTYNSCFLRNSYFTPRSSDVQQQTSQTLSAHTHTWGHNGFTRMAHMHGLTRMGSNAWTHTHGLTRMDSSMGSHAWAHTCGFTGTGSQEWVHTHGFTGTGSTHRQLCCTGLKRFLMPYLKSGRRSGSCSQQACMRLTTLTSHTSAVVSGRNTPVVLPSKLSMISENTHSRG